MRSVLGEAGSLVTSRNNLHPYPVGVADSPLRTPRRYVEACGRGTLAALFPGSKVAFYALTCSSWSCASCRKVKAARLLDRLRRGMESRPDLRRVLLTLTINPAIFGASVVGSRSWDDGRVTTLWSTPTAEQFAWATEVMSTEFHKLNKRLVRKAARAGVDAPGYFRVIELHRNLWPHYHVVLEHPSWGSSDIQKQLQGWHEALGITHVREVSLDDAVGELAPYLTSAESKGGGSKAYQFAGLALPEGFRLHSSSAAFLAPAAVSDVVPEVAIVLKGHFHEHHTTVIEWGGDSRIVLNAPSKVHRPPGGSVAVGDDALRYWMGQAGLDEIVQLAGDELASLEVLEESWG